VELYSYSIPHWIRRQYFVHTKHSTSHIAQPRYRQPSTVVQASPPNTNVRSVPRAWTVSVCVIASRSGAKHGPVSPSLSQPVSLFRIEDIDC
jgi:hypothetical protein